MAPWVATEYVAPHEYVVSDWSPWIEELIERVTQLIRDRGYRRTFRGAPFPTIHLGDHYYWRMPRIVPRGTPGIVLNRALLPALSDDDAAA